MPRGRPRKETSDLLDQTLGDDAEQPKPQTEVKPQRRTRVTKQSAENIKDGIQSALVLVSMGAGMAWPQQWTQDDQLTAEEAEALSTAIYNELALYPRVLRWISSIDKIGPHLALATTVAAVAAPRLVRRNVIPPQAALALMGANAFLTHAKSSPEAMGTGRPPSADRPDQKRKVNTSGVSTPVPEVPDSVSEQDRPSAKEIELPGRSDYPESSGFDLDSIQPFRAEATV